MATSSEGKVLASLREGNQLRPGPTVCSFCDDDAFAKCNTCGKYLCSDCRVSHKKQRASRDHDVVDIGLLTSTAVQVKCRHHRSSDVKYLCHNCTDVCCDSCITDGHRSHKYSDIDESIDNVKDICQDLAKSLRTPFNTIQGNLEGIKTANKSRAKSYKQTTQEILDRKQKLVNLINKIADDEVKSLDNRDSEVEQLFKRTESDIHECQKECEKVLGPVMSIVMGHDVNKIITCIQRIQEGREDVEKIMGDVNVIEQAGSMCLPGLGDSFNTVSDIVRSILTPTTKQGREDSNVSNTAVGRSKKSTLVKKNVQPTIGRSYKTKYTPAYTLSPKEVLSIQMIHKTELDWNIFISQRVHKGHFVRQMNGQAYLVKYDTNFTELTKNLPETIDKANRTILTIDESLHVISNTESLNLCKKSGVVRSLVYIDGHVPCVLAYFNSEMFVSLCIEKKQIRYYNTDNLKVINTYPLEKMSNINLYGVLLVTDNHDILIASDDITISYFTREGLAKDAVPVHPELFNCLCRTMCMIKGDQIIAAKNDGSVHWFNLNGGHRVIGQIDKSVRFTWSIGVEDDEFLYITYSLDDDKDWIAKFTLSS